MGDFIKEQANTLAQYEDLITGGDVENADQITPGRTAVLRQDATKPAASTEMNHRRCICVRQSADTWVA